MNYFSPTVARHQRNFCWSSKGSISGKPSPNSHDDLTPRDSWTHLDIEPDSPARNNAMRLRASELHVTKSGTSFGGATVIIDLDHDSGKQLYLWLKKIYEPL